MYGNVYILKNINISKFWQHIFGSLYCMEVRSSLKKGMWYRVMEICI